MEKTIRTHHVNIWILKEMGKKWSQVKQAWNGYVLKIVFFIRFVLLGHLASSSGLHYINGTKAGIHSLSALKHR